MIDFISTTYCWQRQTIENNWNRFRCFDKIDRWTRITRGQKKTKRNNDEHHVSTITKMSSIGLDVVHDDLFFWGTEEEEEKYLFALEGEDVSNCNGASLSLFPSIRLLIDCEDRRMNKWASDMCKRSTTDVKILFNCD